MFQRTHIERHRRRNDMDDDMDDWRSLVVSLVCSPADRPRIIDECVRLDDEQAVPTLIAFLESEDAGLVICSMRILGRLGDERAVDPLIAILNLRSRRLREHATDALENIGESAVEPLIIVLERALLAREDAKRTEWPPLRHAAWSNLFIAAAGALGGIGDERAIGPLEDAMKKMVDNTLDDKIWNEKKTLIDGWFEAHPDWADEHIALLAVPQLVAAGDANPNSRKSLYATIRTCFADIADEPFRRGKDWSMLGDKDEEARGAAELALRKIRVPSKFRLSDNSE